MLYLLDANVLIRANADYYPLARLQPFWDWLIEIGISGAAKMPFEIYYEISSANGPLPDWINSQCVRKAILLKEKVNRKQFNLVINKGYAPDLTDAEFEEAGRDPFLITYAKMGTDRVVVTKEVSKKTKVRGRRKVPDACDIMGVPWMNDFQFYNELGFRVD